MGVCPNKETETIDKARFIIVRLTPRYLDSPMKPFATQPQPAVPPCSAIHPNCTRHTHPTFYLDEFSSFPFKNCKTFFGLHFLYPLNYNQTFPFLICNKELRWPLKIEMVLTHSLEENKHVSFLLPEMEFNKFESILPISFENYQIQS